MASIDRFQTLEGHTSDVTWVDFNGNKIVVSSSNDKSIRFWKCKDDGYFEECTESPLKSPLNGHNYGVNCVRFSPFGTILASVSTDGYLILWNSQTGDQVVRLLNPTNCAIRVCCFSPSSAILVTAGDDEKICLWDISTRSLVRSLTGHEAMVTTCAFSPDSAYLISGATSGELKMWDARHGHGKCLLTISEAHDLGVVSSDFNPQYEVNATNGPLQSYYLLASCGNDDLVKLWRVKGGSKCSIVLYHSLSGHSGNVYCCRFSNDGTLLASAAGDKTIIIWSIESGTIIRRLEGHNRYVTCCAFSANNSLLATGSNDKTVIIWNLSAYLDTPSTDDNDESPETTYPNRIRGASFSLGTNANLVSRWSVEQVNQWLETLNLSQYSEVFKTNEIDGTELLHLSHDVLLTMLKITTLGHRNKILRGVQALRNPLWQHFANEDDISMPDELFCPITHELMKDPVVASDGYTYERTAITEWVENGNNTSPMTNDPFTDDRLIPNRTLKLLAKRYQLP
ncbi:WD repeat, SAM and U-box domain-containing protein 1-like isoform X2 [Panonychus citri]|uniref:WD repeat, SAM and U-box domain-containing protein 1-like isoform X2 n=1 Tax=Panonychus citri TaxID=50023 RepID=UPI00230798E7|nr:WD repeat, SAM and U-box domain-containing protein 1-like isoform X2 [Panonychus citri]XP_053205131.1 WD repeat, SAM and U-box domain-containing protein 1-like isoform X2 [Panonychus citri]